MRRLRDSISAVLVAALLLAVTATAVQAETGAPVTATGHGDAADYLAGVGDLDWEPCTGTLGNFGAECALLTVPLDYDDPEGETIEIAVSRISHTVPDDEYQGPILINPGGPGGSGLIFAILAFFVPPDVAAAYDWIGFDPRGVGSSVPALSCIADYFDGPRPDYDALTPDVEQEWIERAVAYAAACDANGGDLLDNVKTVDTVRDMDAIRHALGEDEINFYGFSYGTYLAQVYATLYPHRVRRMVLDSNVDADKVWYQANLDQNVAFERVWQEFLGWVASYDDVYGLGDTAREVELAYYGAQASLREEPQGLLGPSELTDGLLVVGYLQEAWPEGAAALAAFVNDGDPGPLTTLYVDGNDIADDNGYAMYLATECTDAGWPSYAKARRDHLAQADRSPFITLANGWFNAPCLSWGAESAKPVTVRDKGIPPILLVSETLDGATPFQGSVEVRRTFPSSVLIATEGGTTHANSLFGGNACVDDPIFEYLRSGELPDRQPGRQPDVVCPATPQPVPTTEVGAAAASGSGVSVAIASQLRAALVPPIAD